MSHATTKPLPCSAQRLAAIADEVPTPFYLYDEQGIVPPPGRCWQPLLGRRAIRSISR